MPEGVAGTERLAGTVHSPCPWIEIHPSWRIGLPAGPFSRDGFAREEEERVRKQQLWQSAELMLLINNSRALGAALVLLPLPSLGTLRDEALPLLRFWICHAWKGQCQLLPPAQSHPSPLCPSGFGDWDQFPLQPNVALL